MGCEINSTAGTAPEAAVPVGHTVPGKAAFEGAEMEVTPATARSKLESPASTFLNDNRMKTPT
jgi:hypothetical protein